jgi:hypothetical protein
MGESIEKLGSSSSPMEEREKSTFQLLRELNGWGKEVGRWMGQGKV